MKGSSVLSVKEQCNDYCSFLFSQTVEDIYLDKITSSGWCGVKVPGLTCLSLRKFQQKRGKGLDLPQRSTCSVRVFPCLCVDVGSLWIGELSTPHWVVTASGLRSSFRSWLPRSSQAVTLSLVSADWIVFEVEWLVNLNLLHVRFLFFHSFEQRT